eukprot:CAMPEP_0197034308 /NCGR_PEP_ID=MMETSP1384-20130603/12463_1 /TAXON_ID=29189 /ORGANISM="Ammonia sp." /LENGTH=525 /DNA_ID=CAMNT_0042464223 /DNA_START=256 /DNA_END=1833 /DNA_ORIENTATION=+
MISYENVTMHRNDKRILVVFDLECLDDIDESDQRLMDKIDNIRQRYINCLDLYNLSKFHYDTYNYSYVWMDLRCPVAVLQEKKNITLNYDELCIEYIMYEPLFWLNQTNATSPTTTAATHQCSNMSTDHLYTYGQDLLDSPWFDGRYSYVDIESVRDIGSSGDAPFIAIIDSGIQSDHIEFLPGQIVHEMGSGPASIDTNVGTLYDSHGTHVAGSASGINYGSSRGLTVYDYKVCEFDEDYEVPCYTSDITDAMEQILQKLNANPGRRGVINLSLGGEKTYAMNDIYHSYFDKMIDAGGIPVVAAGNEDIDACGVSPAYSSKAITVGAFAYDFINSRREKAWFSNWGSCVDIWGPGEDIYSAVPSADSNEEYAFLSGTSMATPLIVGVIANLLAVQPTLSFNGVLDALLANSSEVAYDQCDQYECRAPVYACGKREYGDEIPWEYERPWSLMEIILIIVGGVVVVGLVICVITFCKDRCCGKNHSSHQAVPAQETETVIIADEEEQQAIIREAGHEGHMHTFVMT